MRILIHSASAAVSRTLETLITTAGHSIAREAANADLALVDSLHPAENPPALPTITLAAHAEGDQTLACPIRPQALLQHLLMHTRTRPIALANGWQLDPMARMLTHPEADALPLTEKECTLLKILAVAHPESREREALLSEVWGMAGNADTHTLETHIYRLRGKLTELSPPPGDIVTEGGTYRWAMHAQS